MYYFCLIEHSQNIIIKILKNIFFRFMVNNIFFFFLVFLDLVNAISMLFGADSSGLSVINAKYENKFLFRYI